MTKFVYLNGNVVVNSFLDRESPRLDLTAQQRFSKEFLDQCITVDESVNTPCGWIYDPVTSTFSEPAQEEEPSI